MLQSIRYLTYSDVFIATPTHICKRYCAGEFCAALYEHAARHGAAQVIACNSKADAKRFYGQHGLTYEHFCTDAKHYHDNPEAIHRRIVATMNYLREIFLAGDWKIFLSLEADVILNISTLPDILSVCNDSDYGRGELVLHTNCYAGFNMASELSATDRITLGCTAITRGIIENIMFRYDPGLLAAHHDAFFALDCRAAGYPMLYDPLIAVEHAHDGRGLRGWQSLPRQEIHS